MKTVQDQPPASAATSAAGGRTPKADDERAIQSCACANNQLIDFLTTHSELIARDLPLPS